MRNVAIVAVAALVACTPAEPPAAPPPTATNASAAVPVVSQNDIGGQLNAIRAANGLPALAQSAQLTAAARLHANDMATNGFFGHTGSDNSSLGQRVRAQGFGYCYVAENIAQGQPSVSAVMTSWMNSAGHRANNLSPKPTQYGAARASGDYWVLVFGRPGC